MVNMMARRCWTLLCFLLVSLIAGCGTASGNGPETQTVSPSVSELHDVQEEATRACMAAAGFTYTPKVFVEFGRVDENEISPFDGVTELRNVEEAGYGVSRASIMHLAPMGQPKEGAGVAEVQEYMSALLGSDDSEQAAGGGCRQVGIEARRELEPEEWLDPDEFLRIRSEYQERLQSLPEYVHFSQGWVACMKESGIEPLSSNPLEHKEKYTLDTFFTTQELVGVLYAEELERGSGPLMDLDSISVFDASHIEAVAAQYPEFEAVLNEEINLAKTDTRCRSESSSELLPAAETLQAELLSD